MYMIIEHVQMHKKVSGTSEKDKTKQTKSNCLERLSDQISKTLFSPNHVFVPMP